MSGPIEDITPHVEIEGGSEAAQTLDSIGERGEAAMNKVGDAAEGASEHLGSIEAAARRVGISYDEMAERIENAKKTAVEGAQASGDAVAEQAAKAKEAADRLSELGVIGAEAFTKIIKAAASGDFTSVMTMMFGHVAGAITECVQAAAEFVEKSAEMVETLNALSGASGMSVGELIGLKDAFASVGISTNGFERAVGRLAITIANDWASISQAVRTSSDHQEAAMLHMQETAFGVTKAYQALQSTLGHTTQQAQQDALGVESAALSLKRAQQALSDSASAAQHNSLGVEGAALALRRAQMNLDKDEGRNASWNVATTALLEKNLKIDQDRFAVRSAQLAVEDANRKKANEGLEAMEKELAVRKASQALSDARTKDIEDGIKGMNELKQAHLNISKARLADREAAERQHEVDLKDIPKIAKEIEQVAGGYKKWDDVINHAEISTQTFTKALMLNAAAGKAEGPTTKEMFEELARVIPHMGNSADDTAKKISVMQHTMGAGFRAGQASAAQMLAVFERGPEKLHELAAAATQLEHALNFKQTEKDLTAFNGAFTSMHTVIDIFKAKLSGIMSIPLTAYFDTVSQSLKSPEGNLNKLATACLNVIEAVTKMATSIVSSIAEVASPAFTVLVDAISKVLNIIAKMIDAVRVVVSAINTLTDATQLLGEGATAAGVLTLAFTGMGRALALIIARLAFVSLGIGVVTTATGLLVQGWSKLPDFMGGGQKTADMGAKIEAAGQAITRASGKAIGFSDKTMDNLPSVYGKDDGKDKAAAHLDESGSKLDSAADQHKSAADKHADAATKTDSSAQKMADAGNSIINNATYASDKLSGAAQALTQAAAALTQAANKGGVGRAATGGHIKGPGGPTDDTAGLFALSNGEFVIKTAAVEHYGAPLFDALNNMNIGGFATGGGVGNIKLPSAPAQIPAAASSVLNLTIDGNHFDGLSAPDHVATKLKTYSVTRQTTAAGKRPSWSA